MDHGEPGNMGEADKVMNNFYHMHWNRKAFGIGSDIFVNNWILRCHIYFSLWQFSYL